MEFIVVDKNTIENITDKKKWILGPKGDLEYIDMFGNICSSADAIAVAPEMYSTLLKHKRDNITNTSTDKIHKILVECMVEHYVEFKSPKTFSQKEMEDIARKILQNNKEMLDKYNPTVCHNVCSHTDYFYDVDVPQKDDNSEPANILTEDEFRDKYCKMCGTQRCEGIGTDWFDGCGHRNELKGYKESKRG